jgi:hypothetical protein
MINLDSDVLL